MIPAVAFLCIRVDVRPFLSRQNPVVAELLQSCQGRELDAHYLAFFECFNHQLFFEAHEVLEELWLARRGTAKDLFYKGLIQLAGAFVHIQKRRPQPAASLLELARGNLEPYAPVYDRLEVESVLAQIDRWLETARNGDAWERWLAREKPLVQLLAS